MHRQNYNRQIEDLMQKIKRTEEALRTATTDYILARRDKQVAEARAVTAEADLANGKEEAASKVCTCLHGQAEFNTGWPPTSYCHWHAD